MKSKLHPQVARRLGKSSMYHQDTHELKLLIGGTLSVLGQPLGVGQGNNPTCQSARGISMWSQHAPAKLLNMIIDVCVSNQIGFRYESEVLDTSLGNVIPENFDYNLDPVSILLVPHLDNIYGQMMQKAMLKHPADDPHISVNPAFYGQWIQTGFNSCYSQLTHSIVDYDRFVASFYASFHPLYNGGHRLVYPVPLGIFITNASAIMLGFHAISLLRIAKDNHDQWRAYFYNPNNEGRQNWGQQIKPSVLGMGEMHGESSLPVDQFVSRVYAYHYNPNGLESRLEKVPKRAVKRVRDLAENSWGRKYVWTS
jgi:hypothetical protein